MDASQLLLALGQQAHSNLWTQHYAQQNIDRSQPVSVPDQPPAQQMAENMALLQYWAALSRQQQDHYLSQHSRQYSANPNPQPASPPSLGPEALLFLSQLQHIPGGPQALAAYLSSGGSVPAVAQPSSSAFPRSGICSSFAQPGWPYPPPATGSPTSQQPQAVQDHPKASVPEVKNTAGIPNPAAGGRAGSGSSASSDVDAGPYQAPPPRETLCGSPDHGVPGAIDSAQHSSSDWLVSGLRCAKEKNRAAQRRFRERQKGLITALKSRADGLAKQVEEQKKTIDELRTDNRTLQDLLQAKDKTQ